VALGLGIKGNRSTSTSVPARFPTSCLEKPEACNALDWGEPWFLLDCLFWVFNSLSVFIVHIPPCRTLVMGMPETLMQNQVVKPLPSESLLKMTYFARKDLKYAFYPLHRAV
jgi:hypothetical protein